jgi:hypothetical protein
MNLTNRPLFDRAESGRPGDVDDLLRAFFQAEMPRPWPACPELPARVVPFRPAPERAGRMMTRSRFALAASVGLLLAGLAALGGKFSGSLEAPGGPAGPPTANRVKPYGNNQVDLKEMLIQEQDGTSYKVIVSPR